MLVYIATTAVAECDLAPPTIRDGAQGTIDKIVAVGPIENIAHKIYFLQKCNVSEQFASQC